MMTGIAPMDGATPGVEEVTMEQQPIHGPVVECLVKCAAFAKELETQAHLIHLNIECQNFLSIHEFLKDQYEAHLEQFDVLSEFVRSLDFLMPLCGCGLKDTVCGFRNVEQYEWRHMLTVYYRNMETLACMAKSLESCAASARVIDVQNYAADLVGQCMKASWFVKASLRGC